MDRTGSNFRDQYAVSPSDGARLLGIHRSTFYLHVMPAVWTGEIQSFMIGACRRIVVASLLAWAERQAAREAA